MEAIRWDHQCHIYLLASQVLTKQCWRISLRIDSSTISDYGENVASGAKVTVGDCGGIDEGLLLDPLGGLCKIRASGVQNVVNLGLAPPEFLFTLLDVGQMSDGETVVGTEITKKNRSSKSLIIMHNIDCIIGQRNGSSNTCQQDFYAGIHLMKLGLHPCPQWSLLHFLAKHCWYLQPLLQPLQPRASCRSWGVFLGDQRWLQHCRCCRRSPPLKFGGPDWHGFPRPFFWAGWRSIFR